MNHPPRDPIQLLTISREYGAGGSELGVLLGQQLGWRVLDHELVHQLAERLQCEDAEVAALDEHAPTFLDRIASMGVITTPEAAFHAVPWSTDADRLAVVTREVLLDAAKMPPLIVVGHGGNCLFRGRTDVLRVRVAAPLDVRTERVVRRTGASLADAAADIKHHDSDRQHYLQRYHRSNVHDPCEYDLQINTGTISLDEAAGLILSLVRSDSPR